MTEAEIKNIAKASAGEALREFMLLLGVDVSTSAAMIELQRDFTHLRLARMTRGAVWNKVLMAATGSVVTAAMGLIAFYLTHGR